MFAIRSLMLAAFAMMPIWSNAADTPPAPYPTKTVRIVVPFSPGGGVDVVARIFAQQLATRLDQPFVIENKPGAGGNLGVKYAMTRPADGYTLLVYATVAGMFPLIYADLGYNPLVDIAPISTIATQPMALFATANFPAKSVADLVQLAKESPGKFAFAGIGMGSPQHMAGELLMYRTQTKMIHVPYKGTSLAITDLIAGQTQIAFLGVSSGLPFVKTGKLKVLAVAAARRTELAPELRTMAEEGIPNFDLGITYFVAAPPGTPMHIMKKLNAELAVIAKDAGVSAALQKLGYEANSSTSEQVIELMREENRKWMPVVKAAGLKAE
jgi:tripartite-type tricarboxylate transporter receptor subunit TctC